LEGSTVRCVVNDYPALAASCGADGVHVGASDVAPAEARAIVGPDRCVGATANDLRRAVALCSEPIDYLGVGPAFGTRSKANPAPTLGPAGIREIALAVDCPVIAIGSIGAENCESVLNCGVWGVAVLSAVSRASEPARELRVLRRTIDRLIMSEVN
jgi:thiamine-phosphate pyrophosphorylase